MSNLHPAYRWREMDDWRKEAKRLLFQLMKLENVANNGGKMEDIKRILAETFEPLEK